MSTVHLHLPEDVAVQPDLYSEKLGASFSDYARRAESFLTGLGNLGVVMASTQLSIDNELYSLPNIATWAVGIADQPAVKVKRDLNIIAAQRDAIQARAAAKGHDVQERITRSLRLMNFIQSIKLSYEVDVLHDQKRYVFIFYF